MKKNELQQQYLHLTNEVMPNVAKEQHWPVQFNHCFQRIILDALFEDCWYHHLDRNSRIPAYRQLTEAQLAQSITIGERMIASPEEVKQLNRQSLAHRGKLFNAS